MFESLGRAVYRLRWLVLALAVAFVAFAALWGTRVAGELEPGGFTDETSESAAAQRLLERELGRDAVDVIVLYRSDTMTVGDARFGEAVRDTVDGLPDDVVASATSFWSTRDPRVSEQAALARSPFVSADRHASYVAIQLTSDDDGRQIELVDELQPHLDAPGLTERVGGPAAVYRDITDQTSEDLARAEAISLPVVFVLLVLVFGGLVAATMPLAVGVVTILGGFVALRLISFGTDVSIFALNIVTLLGLGLAIDYGLFMVSRFREELGRGRDVPDALAKTMATAGRTVAVSGVTVGVSLAGLTLFPQMFLKSMGYGGTAAVLVAAGSAMFVLPALLGVLGHRVDALSVRRLFRRKAAPRAHAAAGEGGWARVARSVMRRPVRYAGGVTIVVVLLGLPFLNINFGGVDERVLPESATSRVVAETIEEDFPAQQTEPIVVAVQLAGDGTDADQRAELRSYVGRLADTAGVTGAQVTGAEGDVARVSLDYAGEATSRHARDVVERVRGVEDPDGATVQVGGRSADLVDLLAGTARTLPWLALLVGSATFVLLFLAFGSLLLPLKAVLMNVLSLSATFGALVWIFQEGHLSGLLDFTVTGALDASQPVLVLATVFGLSMDYEVFLLSRVREQYDLTGDNTTAVATGLQRTGRIITSAAMLLVVVVAAFSTSQVTFIKLIGVGIVIAVVVDATLIRVLLVPATMRLLGRANWWAPGPLRKLYARFGIRESDEPAAPRREYVDVRT